MSSTRREYLFGPESVTWKVNRESVLLLGGRPTLLMQLAHPLVAAGVADHSDFRADPIARLRRTLEAMTAVIFGDVRQSHEAAARVNAVHSSVRGTAPDGTPYDARDPKLLLWVHSTLVDAAVRVYESCFGALTDYEIARYYEESTVVAHLFGIPDELVPASLTDLRVQMESRIESGEVRVGDLARELAEPILRPLRFIPRPLAERSAFVTAALLPESIRRGYGLRVRWPGRVLLAAGGRASRVLLPRVPDRFRNPPLIGVGSVATPDT